jgi:hypothetical protein
MISNTTLSPPLDSGAAHMDQPALADPGNQFGPVQSAQSNLEASPGISNAKAIEAKVVKLEEMSGSALHVRVELLLPPAPQFVAGPKWNASLSSSDFVVVTGELDSPGIVYYAVCHVLLCD